MERAGEQGATGVKPAGIDKPIWHAVIAWPAIALLRVYQYTLGTFLGGRCRFYPSCSHYAVEAFQTHRPQTAAWLTFKRLSRCHPLGGHGVDMVPPAAHAQSNADNATPGN